MCGIIHIKREKGIHANKSVIKRYKKQKSRGTQGFGFIEIKNGIVIGGKRAEEEKEILKALEESTADEILFHHRTPTSTPNFVESTHPIQVKHKSLKYDYYVVHNGIIQNDEELKKEHDKEKFNYTTKIVKQWVTKGNTYSSEIWNDSEALAIDFAKAIENDSFIKSKGSIAVIALQVDKRTKKAVALYYGRNSGNPLKVELGKDLFGISSESGKELKINTLYKYDYVTGEISEKFKTIGTTYTYNGYYDGNNDYPAYGHWDEETGQWVNTGRKQLGVGKDAYEDDEEVGHLFQWDEEVADLKDEIKRAYRLGDYDTAMELEEELEEMEANYKEMEQENKHNEHMNNIKASCTLMDAGEPIHGATRLGF